MQPVPDHTRNRTRNRSLRFCFRFRFRIWLAVYQFNAHFGARLGFVLCFVFCCSRRRRVAYLARRVRTEDWRLSSSWKLGSAAVADDDDDVGSAACSARVRFVCRAEGSAFRRSCAFRQRRQNVASPVRSSSFGFVQPRVVFCCSYFAFVFRSSHFAFCFSCFVFSLASFFSPTGFTVDSVYFFAVPANVPVLTALVSSLRHIPCYFILYSSVNENI